MAEGYEGLQVWQKAHAFVLDTTLSPRMRDRTKAR